MTRLIVMAAAALMSASCARAPSDGPPQLRIGRDECAECGMLIQEDRCSAGVVVDINGRRRSMLFDDIGCLLEYFSDEAGAHIHRRYVHDHGTRAWIDAEQATFVVAERDRLQTPMGSGIVAFEDPAHAAAAAAEYGGVLMKIGILIETRSTKTSTTHEESK